MGHVYFGETSTRCKKEHMFILKCVSNMTIMQYDYQKAKHLTESTSERYLFSFFHLFLFSWHEISFYSLDASEIARLKTREFKNRKLGNPV